MKNKWRGRDDKAPNGFWFFILMVAIVTLLFYIPEGEAMDVLVIYNDGPIVEKLKGRNTIKKTDDKIKAEELFEKGIKSRAVSERLGLHSTTVASWFTAWRKSKDKNE